MVKKGQMKIQQMAFMLMAITIFFVLVGMFILMFSLSGVRESAEELEQKNAMLLVSKLSNSPEFACGNSFGNNKINCIDADKAMVLKDSISRYASFWGSGVDNIIIRKSTSDTNEDCTLGNYPNCDVINLFSKNISGFPAENFVTLCVKGEAERGVYNKCEVAKLVIYYSEN